MKNKKEIERRTLEIRVEKRDDGPPVIVGTPIVYNKRSEDMGFFEIIKPGAARNALKNSDVRALYNHSSDILPLGRQSAGTLELTNRRNGVDAKIYPPDTQFARDLAISIERGDISEMSFGFTVAEDRWDRVDGADIRTIIEIREIFDISTVPFAAYSDTKVALRSLEKHKTKETLRNGEAETRLEDEQRNLEIDIKTIQRAEDIKNG